MIIIKKIKDTKKIERKSVIDEIPGAWWRILNILEEFSDVDILCTDCIPQASVREYTKVN